VLFALEFSDNVDPTAIATIALAVLTLAAVVVGGKALSKTQTEIEWSRKEVEEAHRPVLIPVYDEAQELQPSGTLVIHRAKPRYQERERVVLPIKNIGSGPALNIMLSLAPLPANEPAGDRDALRWSTTRILGLGVMEILWVTVRVPDVTEVPDFALSLVYMDVAEKVWKTEADYIALGDGEYGGMSIDAGPAPVDKPKA
jgi:hypothetical protein